MKRLLLSFFLLGFVFSSCVHPTATDTGKDEALGLGNDSSKDEAQQELNRLQASQMEEQKRQLDRQITDPLNSPSNNR